MAYDVNQTEASFRIPAENTQPALSAVLALFSPDDISLASGGTTTCGPNARTFERWFAFTDAALLDKAAERRDLAYALHGFRFRPERERDGTITKVTFEGTRVGDEHFLFAALGPYVDAGSFIEMVGEDGARWRWTFDGATCRMELLTPSEYGPEWLRVEATADEWSDELERAQAAFEAELPAVASRLRELFPPENATCSIPFPPTWCTLPEGHEGDCVPADLPF